MRILLILASISLVQSGAVAAQQAGEPDATELDPITVVPQDDPFDDSMQRIRKAFEDPECRGCPPAIRAYRPSVYEQLGDIVSFFTGLGAVPPQMTPAERVEYRVRNDWRKAAWGPEMADYR